MLYRLYIKAQLSEPLYQFKTSKVSILAGCYPLLFFYTVAVYYYYYYYRNNIYG